MYTMSRTYTSSGTKLLLTPIQAQIRVISFVSESANYSSTVVGLPIFPSCSPVSRNPILLKETPSFARIKTSPYEIISY